MSGSQNGSAAQSQGPVPMTGARNLFTQDGMANESTALQHVRRLRGASDNAAVGWMADSNGLAILLVRVDAKLVCDVE